MNFIVEGKPLLNHNQNQPEKSPAGLADRGRSYLFFYEFEVHSNASTRFMFINHYCETTTMNEGKRHRTKQPNTCESCLTKNT
jgi:hypothetical protein